VEAGSIRRDVALVDGDPREDDERRAAIVLIPGPASSSAGRSFVSSMLEQWDCEDPDEIVPLLTSEIVSNAVRHAKGSVSLQVALLHDDELRVEARDGSPDSPVIRRANPGGVGGHGLTIIESLARRWGVERHQDYKVVWFESSVAPRARHI
jgi:anti-sigma regulatory factor (Ser/Thr protein kinase)